MPCVEKWALTHDRCLEGTAVRGKVGLDARWCLEGTAVRGKVGLDARWGLEGSVVREVAVLAHGV